MKNIILYLLIFFSIANITQATEIKRFHYIPQSASLERVIVNNADNPPPQNSLPHLVANNIVSEDEEITPLPSSIWSGNYWTNIDELTADAILQKSLTKIGGFPKYGNTVVQVSNHNVGFHLNTFSTSLPTMYTATSLQYFVGWEKGKKVWYPNEKLCLSGQAKIASSFSTGQAVNQVMYTLHFTSIKGNMLFLNVMLFDSRNTYKIEDSVHWDEQDTGTAIVISHAQSQEQNSSNVRYTSTIDGYGSLLLPAKVGNAPSIKGDYGFCISQQQFSLAVNDINNKFGKNYSTSPENWLLDFFLLGPEINIRPNSSLPQGNGHIGMSVGEIWVYNK
ncbi:hypothetical protein KCM76_23950 [Zooshikella marina]|uniref:hypothetical protein n=1 Tax=Zooshikella ganghwensis TaxID=202772 RepID=UPI001BAF4D2E|nr:hypothetical protein [Zooshikella ganghwensis]MBU2709070.1 hypothetical protein [Zooshikella ganghwensis]